MGDPTAASRRTDLEREIRETKERLAWLTRKLDGVDVAFVLTQAPVGAEFTLSNVGRAYSATYRKNDRGLWDQIKAVEPPLVLNMDAEHLGFCVGFDVIVVALDERGLTSCRA